MTAHRVIGSLVVLLVVLLSGCGTDARIDGEHALSDSELLMVARRPLTAYAANQERQADLIDAADSMRDRLDREGYPWAQVTPQAGTPPVFTIVQGPRVALHSIAFTGDTVLTTAELTAAAACGRWYTSADAAAIRGRVTRALRGAGHLQATVASPEITWSDDRSRADLTLAVQAGPRFTLRSVRLELVPDSDPADHWSTLLAQLDLLLDKPGSVCRPRAASIISARLRGVLLNQGYRDAQVTPTQEFDSEAGQVDLVFAVAPGRVHVLRELTIDGGARSTRAFVRRRLRQLQPGQPLAQNALDQAVTDLSLTGFYRRVQALPVSGPPAADGTVPDDVRIELRELPTQHVDFAVGYGSYERFRGGVTYVDEHLFGDGLRFTVGADASTVGWSTQASLADPYRFGPGRRVTLDIAYDERQEPSYAHQDASAGLSFSQRFKPAVDPVPWEGRAGYRFTRSYDYRIEAIAPGDEPDPLYTTAKLTTELRRDSRQPRFIDPDSGTLSRIGVGWSAAPLGATVDYGEVLAEWSGSWSPAAWLVGTLHGACMTRDPLVVDSLPIGERLFMGGADTVRSFTQDNLGPRSSNGEPLGGLTNAVTNIELRWRPFVSLRQLEFATFYDLGTVDPAPWSLSAPWGEGIGAGIRYRTPVGPIRFDGAYNPGNTLGATSRYALAVAVGFAF